MSQKGKTLLKGHSLVMEGHTSTPRTDRISGETYFNYDHRSKVAHCSCGAASPSGLSVKGNQRWHREHKDAIRDQMEHRSDFDGDKGMGLNVPFDGDSGMAR